MINIEKLKYIKLALMKKESEIDKDNKSDFEVFKSAKFKITPEFLDMYIDVDKENLTEFLLNAVYKDLISNIEYDENECYLGLWINYNDIEIDNSISLSTMSNIKEYSNDEVNPVYEFLKMTTKQYETCS
jgi:hypothetical protein